MAIEFICPTCQQQLRVPDTAAGKNAKCPKCASILSVPAAKEEVSPLAPPPQAGFNFAPLPSAQSATAPIATTPPPPVSKTFITPAGGNPFAADPGQLPNTTQAMMPPAGKPQVSGSQPAMSTVPHNPYASPQHTYIPRPGPNVRVELSPIVDHAIKVWQENLGVLVLTTIMPALIFIPLIGLTMGGFMLGAVIQEPVIFVLGMIAFVFVYFALIFSQVYFHAGQNHVAMLVARGQPVSVRDMFIGMDKFLPLLGHTLLVMVVVLMTLPLLYVPLIFLFFFYWPAYQLVADGKCGVMESFSVAQRITEGNKLTTFLIVLVGGGFITLGELACFVGLLFAMPLVKVMWCTAYLMMSGQIPVPQRPRPYPQQPPPGYGSPGYGAKQGPPPMGYLPPAGK